jgi:hypothetical protein
MARVLLMEVVFHKILVFHYIQDVELSAKCGCIMCATIIYQRTTNILVCSICQKIANCV